LQLRIFFAISLKTEPCIVNMYDILLPTKVDCWGERLRVLRVI
jgi:hypothetical protein